MVYGDGDGDGDGDGYASANDVVVDELTHGVTQ